MFGLPTRFFPSFLALALIGLSAALLLSGLDQLTRDRIALAEDRRALAALTGLLGSMEFDNEPARDWIELPITGLDEPARIHRARLEDEPVALLVDLTTPRGYSGDIRLLIAADPDGMVLGVRVLEHRETPGLGDRIERERSDWIEQFDGRSLGDPPAEAWAPDRRGGDFDTMTNATITASAVIEATRLALEVIEATGERIWREPVESAEHD